MRREGRGRGERKGRLQSRDCQRREEVGGCEGEEKGKYGEERKQGRRKGCTRMFPTADGNHLTDNVRTGTLTWIRGGKSRRDGENQRKVER